MFKQLFKRGNESDSADSSTVQNEPNIQSAIATTGKSLITKILALSVNTSNEPPLDESSIETIEDMLIKADVGVALAVSIADAIRDDKKLHQHDALKAYLRDTFSDVLNKTSHNQPLIGPTGTLTVVLVVGVNGAGKTTLIGKLAHRLTQQGKNVLVAAGDTFRAAAEEQLSIWAQRAGATLVQLDTSDAAAVAFEALQQAKVNPTDVLIIDTAGRLQNQYNLMEELRKIKRIIEREAPSSSHYEALLVVDANTGQNALQQAKLFKEAVNLTGVALTKLDGSAKGGIVLNIAQQHHLPVKLVGVGEGINDLRDFDPNAFLDGLFNV